MGREKATGRISVRPSVKRLRRACRTLVESLVRLSTARVLTDPIQRFRCFKLSFLPHSSLLSPFLLLVLFTPLVLQSSALVATLLIDDVLPPTAHALPVMLFRLAVPPFAASPRFCLGCAPYLAHDCNFSSPPPPPSRFWFNWLILRVSVIRASQMGQLNPT